MAKGSINFGLDLLDQSQAITALRRATKAIALEMEIALRKKISRQGPPRSKPGEPPRMDSGLLHATARVIPQGLSVKVSVQDYGLFLEEGTVKMDPRPFIRPVITDKLDFWRRKIIRYARDLSQSNRSRRT